MNGGTWIAIYMPMFILFVVIIPQQQRTIRNSVILKMKKKKGMMNMLNEIVKKHIGKNCLVSTGTFGVNINGKLIEVNEKWIEVETKKGNELVNFEFIQRIKIKDK